MSGDAGCGDHCTDPSGSSGPGHSDQADRSGFEAVAEHRAQGGALGRDDRDPYPIQRVLGDLPKAEIADKKARSIKYQMTITKLPMAKELGDFDFSTSPVNEPLVRDLATGAFLDGKRNLSLYLNDICVLAAYPERFVRFGLDRAADRSSACEWLTPESKRRQQKVTGFTRSR